MCVCVCVRVCVYIQIQLKLIMTIRKIFVMIKHDFLLKKYITN